jgi:hypothetical protein
MVEPEMGRGGRHRNVRICRIRRGRHASESPNVTTLGRVSHSVSSEVVPGLVEFEWRSPA